MGAERGGQDDDGPLGFLGLTALGVALTVAGPVLVERRDVAA
jgi:hypothetical protein